MSDITANEYRTAAKVDRFHGGQSAAQFYEDNARALESEDLVTQVAMQFAGSTWGGRDAEEQFALAGSERALAYLVGAGRLILAGGTALTAEQVEDVQTVVNCAMQYGNIASREAAARLDSSLAPAEPAEEETKAEGPCEVRSPDGDVCEVQSGHAGVHTWAWPEKKAASSPFETESWERIEDVPVGVLTKDREGEWWVRLANNKLIAMEPGDGDAWTLANAAKYAPFVAAEEGRA